MEHTTQIIGVHHLGVDGVAAVIRCCADPSTDFSVTIGHAHMYTEEELQKRFDHEAVQVARRHDKVISHANFLENHKAKSAIIHKFDATAKGEPEHKCADCKKSKTKVKK